MAAGLETAIAGLAARGVWDGGGRPALEVEVRLACGAVGRAMSSSSRRPAPGAGVELRDGGAAFGGLGVGGAIRSVREEIASVLRGLDARDQGGIDRRLALLDGTPNKARLGANATIAVSLAVARAAAVALGEPLWRHLGGAPAPCQLPLPIIEVLGRAPGGGGSATGNAPGIAAIGVIATGAETLAAAIDWPAEVVRVLAEALGRHGARLGVSRGGGFVSPFDEAEAGIETVVRAIERAGFAPGEDLSLAVDVGAGAFGRGDAYVLAEEARQLDIRGMIETQLGWIGRSPIAVLEDPLAPDAGAGWPALTRAAGAGIAIVAGDLLASDSRRIPAAAEANACNAIRIEPVQAGTLTEARVAVEAARSVGWRVVLSGGWQDCGDAWPAELAVAWGCDMVRAGGLLRADGVAPLNELLRIASRVPRDVPLAPRRGAGW